MVYQDPMQALNPSMRLGDQLKEVLTVHHSLSDEEAEDALPQDAAPGLYAGPGQRDAPLSASDFRWAAAAGGHCDGPAQRTRRC